MKFVYVYFVSFDFRYSSKYCIELNLHCNEYEILILVKIVSTDLQNILWSKQLLLKVLGLGPKLKVQLFLENLATDYVPAGLAVSILYDHKTYTVHKPYIPVSFCRQTVKLNINS